MAGTKIKTQVTNLKYVYITGEGRDQALKGEPPRMQYVSTAVMKKDSGAHKDIEAQINAEWEKYKTEFGVKGKPKTNGIKEEFMKDPKGTIDPETEEVKRVPTGNILVTFKTNTKWADGKPQVVLVKDRKGADITKAINSVDWAIGEGSQGIVHGTAMGNNIGGTHKVTLYLTAIQLAKLVKYSGTSVECDEIDGDDLDLDSAIDAVDTTENTPDL